MGRTAILAVKILGDASGAQKAFSDTDRDLSRMADGFDALVGPATAVTAGIVAGAGFAAKAASDLAESQSKVNVVFGQSAAEIEAWSKTAATSMGMSQQAALDAAGSFGTMFTQLGFSTDEAVNMSTGMIQLSSDLASFHNVAGGAAAVTDMMSAAMRGEYDSIQALIPTINATAVANRAMEDTGKTSAAALTDQEKAAATMALIMEGAGPAVGDFARTQDGAANSTRIAQASFQDAAAALGEALLPVLVTVTGALTDLATWVSQNTDLVLVMVGVVGALTGAIVAVKVITVIWTTALNVLKVAMGLVRAAQIAWTVATNAYAIAAIAAGAASMIAYWPILLIIAAIGALIAIIVVIVKNWDKLIAAFKTGAAWMKDKFVGAWNAVGDAISKVVDWFQRLWDKAQAVWDGIKGFIDKINPFASSVGMTFIAAPAVSTRAAPASTTTVTINYQAGITGSPVRDGRILKRIIEGEDVEQGRRRGEPLAVAW